MPPTSRDAADGSGLASSADRARREIGQVSVWRHNITVADGVVTPGTENCYDELKQFRFPDSFARRRVLDVGCSDGFYSFETERRGASEVVAVDDESSLLSGGINGFRVAAGLLDSRVVYQPFDIHQADPETIGRFDDILFLNVLYHLKSPVEAMERLRSVANPGARLFLKTIVWQDARIWVKGRPIGLDFSRRPKFWFFPGTELGGDPTNWWAPNRSGIEALLAATGWGEFQRMGRKVDRDYYVATAS